MLFVMLPQKTPNDDLKDIMGNQVELDGGALPRVAEFVVPENPNEKVTLNKLDFEQVRLVFSHTQGEILTILDATFVDAVRLKYVKDLVRKTFSSQGNWLFELAVRDFGKTPKV